MIQMELARIIIQETTEEQIIVLREVGGSRAFPIVIGLWEALAIDRNLKEKRMPRPMTHDLIGSVIQNMDGSLDRIIVSDLRERTFYAKLMIRRNGKTIEVDSRPSDAIAIAVGMRVPIYVEEIVLEKVGGESEGGPGAQGFEPEADDEA